MLCSTFKHWTKCSWWFWYFSQLNFVWRPQASWTSKFKRMSSTEFKLRRKMQQWLQTKKLRNKQSSYLRLLLLSSVTIRPKTCIRLSKVSPNVRIQVPMSTNNELVLNSYHLLRTISAITPTTTIRAKEQAQQAMLALGMGILAGN